MKLKVEAPFLIKISLLFYFIVVLSCSNKNENVGPDSGTNDSTLSNAPITNEYVKAIISGDTTLNWDYSNSNDSNQNVSYYSEGTFVQVRSGLNFNQDMLISLRPYYGSGKYTIRGDIGIRISFKNSNPYLNYTTSSDSTYSPYYKGSGQIILKEVSNGFRGTFRCIAFSDYGDSISVSEGRFAVKYPFTYPGCIQDSYSGPILDNRFEDYCRMVYYSNCHGNNEFYSSVLCNAYSYGQEIDSTMPNCPYCD